MNETATSSPSETTPPPTDLLNGFSENLSGLMNGEMSGETAALVMKGGTALLMLIVTYFAAKLAARWVSTALCSKIDMTLGRFAGKLTFYSIIVVAGLTILQTAGVSITSFAAVMAAAGFAIGLAFQGTLSNFSSGILLLVFRPFRVGDVVSAAGVMGKVFEIDLFTTMLDTPDNRRLILPNSSIAGAIIENITYHKQRRVEVTVGVSYAASLDDTRAVLVASAEKLGDKLIRGDGRGYQILLTNLGASSVDWTVRFWTASENFFAVKEALIAEIKRQLDEHDIEIPFPQMQLHLTEDATKAQLSGAHSALPIPKLNSGTGPARSHRIRPRVRGDNAEPLA